MIKPGDVITDGTVKWTVRDIRGRTDGNPVGTIIAFAGNGALPEGYLLCDGSAVSRTDYAALFAVIGGTYGVGDGSTTFNLPHLTSSQYLRGYDVAGEYQTPGLPNITGRLLAFAGFNLFAFYQTNEVYGYAQAVPSGHTMEVASFSANKSNDIFGRSATVRPLNMSVRFIIKY